MIRYIFRCQEAECGHLWAFDYEKSSGWLVPRRPYAANAWGYTTADGDKLRGCPKCGKRKVRMSKIHGEYAAGVACDERCTGAITARCTCSCGGANHGKDHIHDQ